MTTGSTIVRPSRAVVLLSCAVAALALVAAAAGLFWPGGEGASTFTTLRGETVELYGEGLYRHDTLFRAGANQGADIVTLLLGIPLLLLAVALYRRATLRGALVLSGALTWFLYVYASLALGAAYNGLFLVYVALFGSSVAAFVLTFLSLDVGAARAAIGDRLPRRALGVLMLASGVVTLGAWTTPLAASLVQGKPPGLLESYATMVTDALDLGLITPACLVAGVLILRREAAGYLVAFPLLVLVSFLAPMMAAQTAMQLAAGVDFTAGQIVGIIGSFATISLLGLAATVVVLRRLPAEPRRPVDARPARVAPA